MWPKLNQLLKNQGFRLPREHGLTIIWTGAISLGLGISIMNEYDISGLFFSLLFVLFLLNFYECKNQFFWLCQAKLCSSEDWQPQGESNPYFRRERAMS